MKFPLIRPFLDEFDDIENEDYQLYNGCCLNAMQDIEDESVDLILADLPYGTTACAWDTVIDLPSLWEHYLRIAKPNAAIVLTAQTPFDKVLGMSNLAMLKYEWIWEKNVGTGFLNAKKAPLKTHENVLVFYKSSVYYCPLMTEGKPYNSISGNKDCANYREGLASNVTNNHGTRYPRSVLRFKENRCQDRGGHPTQKPVALMEYLVRTYTNPNATVLDNTMGSGTTGVACANAGRKFIGIEKDPSYFKKAQSRIEDAYAGC